MARRSNHPATLAGVVIWAYGFAIHYEVLRADDSTLRAIQEAVQIAEASSNDVALSVAEYSLGVALLSRDAAADRRRGLELIVQVRDIWLRKQVALQMVPIADLWVAQAEGRGRRPRCCHCGDAQSRGRAAPGRTLGYGVWGTGVLAEALLERGAQGDLAEAQEAIDRLANLPADEGWAMREITLLRLRALVSRARGDDVAYRDLVSRYRAMAESLGFEGHMKWAEEMP